MNKIIKGIAIGIGIVSCIGMGTNFSAYADNTLTVVGNKASINQTGWITNSNGGWTYSKDGQTLVNNDWVQDNGEWYYLDEYGVMKTGWLNDHGTWYYLNNNGTMAKNTTIEGCALNGSGVWVQNAVNNNASTSNNISKTTNEYVSNTPAVLINVVHISPKHVYYKDGILVMEAYVYNGFGHSVWNLNNANIKIGTPEKVVASAHFNSLDGLQIGGNNYAIWTFNFPKDCVFDQNANLHDIKWEANIEYKY